MKHDPTRATLAEVQDTHTKTSNENGTSMRQTFLDA